MNNDSKGAFIHTVCGARWNICWLEYKLSESCLLLFSSKVRTSTKKGLRATTAICRSFCIMRSRPAEYNLTVPLGSDVLVWTLFSGVVHHTFGYVSSKDDFFLAFLKPLSSASASFSDSVSSRSDCLSALMRMKGSHPWSWMTNGTTAFGILLPVGRILIPSAGQPFGYKTDKKAHFKIIVRARWCFAPSFLRGQWFLKNRISIWWNYVDR